MPVYTDGVHLAAKNVEDLHTFAEAIGLGRHWFERHRKPHYDLGSKPGRFRSEMLARALELGAKKVTSREIVLMFQQKEK